ncbi:MAG: ATP-dependent 6-phosphofructokinase 1 [Flavobacteriales bacterium UBA4585]|jgi:6-phosphofructokinase 1|nr:6-phosphofructokinase [Schleiferiaceae bacterium]MDP4758455.1 6-phosphofructokinase [Schleiferiaceae bacterium]MDP4767089.1 6-phosphofructokinase [Schleiferiaceae bacterium]MDP4958530.1 6-phosphofructokinase [Schleiferiaceae bacterium]CAI8162885.1 MAG: ATP-dependent 6-phosphofructokinase 1 [Flavobacteriales bacterium UBA4585]
MSTEINNIAVLTSGGDAPGMNAAIRAVTRTALYHGKRVFGVYRGYEGMIENDIVELSTTSVKHILALGGTFLKSARSQEFRTPEGRAKAAQNLRERNIDALVVIGGDGSFTGALKLAEEHGIKVIGVPGTIDNDLYGTDYTIGYDTATNTVIESVDKIRDTASSHNRLFLVEVMGRDTGYIAASTGLATGALSIILPEKNNTYEELFADLRSAQANKKTSNIIMVAEGNHLGDIFEIASAVRKEFPSIDVKVTTLGHTQRGGSPSTNDRVLASVLGHYAIKGLMEGQEKVMSGMINQKVVFTPLGDAISKTTELDYEMLTIAKILAT